MLTTDAWSAPGHYSIRFDAEEGEHYALFILPRAEQTWVGMAGGVVAQAIEASGTFRIDPVPVQ